MKRVVLLLLMGTFTGPFLVNAQQDTLRRGSMHFRTVKIIGNDTVVNERHIDLDNNNRGTNLFFRFGDDFDTLIGGEDADVFNWETDSLIQQYFAKPLNRSMPFFPGDSLLRQFRFGSPDLQFPGFDFYRFDFRDPGPGIFQFPDGSGRRGYFAGQVPHFSIEDVAIYPEKNSVKNFMIRPVPGQNILVVEADLDNKRSVYTVYDNKGRTIHYEKIRRVDGEFRRILSLDEMKSGMYFVEIKNGKSTKKKRLIIR